MKNILIIILSLFTSLSYGQSDSKMGFEINNIGDVNSQYLDFGTSFYNDGIVFSSNRKNNPFSCNDPVTKGGYSDIYYAKEGDNGFSTPVMMEGNVKSKYHDGVPTFNVTNDRMIISRSNSNGKNQRKTIVVKLYETKMVNGVWTELEELPFCSDEYSTMHPTYDPNANILYFASNMPDTYGGMDLYAVTYEENGNWGVPINLGQSINSGDNEVFPFKAKNNVLFFSSNGHGSTGGLDVFASLEKSDKIVSLDQINTVSDDFGFVVKNDGVSGFISSDRVGGAGKDDIYKWNYIPIAKEIQLCTQDDSGQVLSNVNIEIKPEINDLSSMIFEKVNLSKSTLETKMNGKTDFLAFPKAKYSIVVEKDGYESVMETMTGTELINWNGCFILNEKSVWIEGIVSNKTNGDLLNNSKIEITSECLTDTKTLRTNKKGHFKLKAKCGCKYQIHASKHGFSNENSKMKILGCENMNTKIKLAPKRAALKKERIVIQDIYYDYDKYDIRSDAEDRLNNLISVLKRYPSLVVQMISHTDKRGNVAYNEKLSANRANAARDYLVSKGISSKRIVLDHKGKLVNKVNCETCDENSHQQNRRTEIRIILNNENVEVIYQE